MNCNLKEYKEFIDNEMLLILGQMDKATLIFDHVYLVGQLSVYQGSTIPIFFALSTVLTRMHSIKSNLFFLTIVTIAEKKRLV